MTNADSLAPVTAPSGERLVWGYDPAPGRDRGVAVLVVWEGERGTGKVLWMGEVGAVKEQEEL